MFAVELNQIFNQMATIKPIKSLKELPVQEKLKIISLRRVITKYLGEYFA